MEHKTDQHAAASSLKELDFVSWRIEKVKKKLHKEEVDRQLSLRPRLRRETVH